MSENSLVPKVEIVENGVPVQQERINPNVAQFIMQAAQTAQLVKLRKLEQSKIPIGVKPLKRTVTDSLMEIVLEYPWISLSITNDGAGAVSISINNTDGLTEEDMLDSGDTASFNLTYPVIKKLFLRAESGTTAAVRIYGTQGKVL